MHDPELGHPPLSTLVPLRATGVADEGRENLVRAGIRQSLETSGTPVRSSPFEATGGPDEPNDEDREEGQYQGNFFRDTDTEVQRAAARRLLRVGISRSRHQVAINRPQGAPALVTPAGASVLAQLAGQRDTQTHNQHRHDREE